MPNIIEQQDLLKGLPDNRLALLMQKPDASIPPFLVAAEAQRRQAIRQQYAGQGQQESVVDTLTKQMANVPQNIQAGPQTPPNIPPPMQPQMPQQMQGGIAAIPQAPQQMAAGGRVHRFAAAGFAVSDRVQQIADQFGVTVDQAKQMIANNPSLSGQGGLPGSAFNISETNQEAPASSYVPDIPVLTRSPTEMASINRDAAREAKYQEMDNYGGYAGPSASGGMTPDISIPRGIRGLDMFEPSPYEDLTTKPKSPRSETAGQDDTSAENKDKAESASYRKRLEEIYGVSEPSNWEEAQKWFVMASEIMNPNATLMQGLVNAGGAYAQAEAGQAQDQRAMEIERQKALLQYDIGERDYGRQLAAQRHTDTLEAMKYQAGAAYKEADLYRKAADDAGDALNRQISALAQSGMMQDEIAKDPTVIALQSRVDRANEALKSAMIRSQGFSTMFGNMYGLPQGFEGSDGESFFNVGG